MIEVEIYNSNLTSPTLMEIVTPRVENLRFSTRLHGGFHLCSFDMKADLIECYQWLYERIGYRVVISDGAKTLFEGRLEEPELSLGKIGLTFYGYYANLSDVPHSTAYNDTADVVIKAVLTACCTQISTDQTHIDATNITVTSGANASYLDIYPQRLVENLLKFSDSTYSRWYFAIWENRIPYLSKRSITSVNWQVNLRDFTQFNIIRRLGDLWNSSYAIYSGGGTAVLRTANYDNTYSQSKYNLTRQYVVSSLGTVTSDAALSSRAYIVEEYKELYPRLSNVTLGEFVYDSNGVRYPSHWVRAGEVIRVLDLLPSSSIMDSVTRDAQTTFYITETEYDADSRRMSLVFDTENESLDAILARYIK